GARAPARRHPAHGGNVRQQRTGRLGKGLLHAPIPQCARHPARCGRQQRDQRLHRLGAEPDRAHRPEQQVRHDPPDRSRTAGGAAMTPHIQARCETVRPEAGNVKVFTLRVQGGHFDFLRSLQAGKHVALSYPDTGGVIQQRLYSITRKPDADLFEIAVKGSGRNSVSDHMHATLREGMTVPLQYVAGDISVDSILGYQRIAMIAGGIGITLPIALLRELAQRARSGLPVPDVQLLLSIPRVSDIPFLHELLELDLTTAWFSLNVFVTRENIRSSAQFKVGRPSSEALQHLQDPQAVV